MPTTAEDRVEALEAALATGAGVVSVSIDGQTVTYNRADARAELQFWARKRARERRQRPAAASIRLGGIYE